LIASTIDGQLLNQKGESMIRRPATRLFARLGASLFLLLFSVASGGQPAPGVVRVTDAGALAAMGFGPGAIVYRAVRPGGAGSGAPGTPEEFGTAVTGYSVYNANQFHGRTSTYSWECVACAGEVAHSTGDPFADVQVEMPGGASLTGVRWWGYDDASQDLTIFLYKTCLPASGAGAQVSTLIDSGGSSGTPGETSGLIEPTPEEVDNEACSYWVRVQFGDSTPALQFYKVRVEWTRQVSPAPAEATFGDVPTDHPFFQFIEALAASGITGGCSAAPPLYCPDAPLTRGQMAVFLAKGLGLQWP
jgi:hypothetical protein